ncbi:tetratricopeptide repeat protein [candidate division KSB1 bacterium]|nr:tetratricopeptide repeat protein [candidate division KSB1 bacterium]
MQHFHNLEIHVTRVTLYRIYLRLVEAGSNVIADNFINLPEILPAEIMCAASRPDFLPDPDARLTYGQELYRIFLAGPIGTQLEQILQTNRLNKKFTRLGFRFEAQDALFSSLSWELLHNGTHFLVEIPLLSIYRLPIDVTKFSLGAVNSPLRILILPVDPQPTHPADPEATVAYSLPLFNLMAQDLVEVSVCQSSTARLASDYIQQFKPHVLWLQTTADETSDLPYIGELKKLLTQIPLPATFRLLMLGGAQIQPHLISPADALWLNRITQHALPACIYFSYKITPVFLKEFIQSLVQGISIDVAFFHARDEALGTGQKEQVLATVLMLNDFRAVHGVIPMKSCQFSPDHLVTDAWKVCHPVPRQIIRHQGLITISQELFEHHKLGVNIYGAAAIGKSELVHQFIMTYGQRFVAIEKFYWRDYHLPHQIISRIAYLLNKTEFYNSDLTALHLNSPDKQMEWLIEGLNRVPMLLIFEGLDANTVRPAADVDVFNLQKFIRILLYGVTQNTKFIFVNHRALSVFKDLTEQISYFEVPALSFEQSFTLLLAGLQAADTKLMHPTPTPVLPFINQNDDIQSFWTIYQQFKTYPALLQQIRYLTDLLPHLNWETKLVTQPFSETQTEIFRQIFELLSSEIRQILLICCSIEPPIELQLLQFLTLTNEQTSAKLLDFLAELKLCGIISFEFRSLIKHTESVLLKVDPDFKIYFKQELAEAYAQQKKEIAARIASYYLDTSEKDHQLWSLLLARDACFQAQDPVQTESLTNKILAALIQTRHQELAILFLEKWLEQHSIFKGETLISALNQLTKTNPFNKIVQPFFSKVENWVDELSEVQDKAHTFMSLGHLFAEYNAYAPAIRNYEKSLPLFETLQLKDALFETNFELANIFYKIKENQKAQKYYEKSLSYKSERSDPRILYKLGNLAYLEGRLQMALNLYVEGLALAIESDSQELMAQILHQLGMLHTDQKNYQEAIQKFTQSIQISLASQNQAAYADTLHELGNVQFLGGDYAKALENYEQSFLISAEQGDIEDTGISLYQIGMSYKALGQNERALEKLNESLEIVKKIADENALMDTNYQLGLLYSKTGDLATALTKFQNSLEAARQTDNLFIQADILNEIGLICMANGENAEALKYLETGLTVAEQCNDSYRSANSLQHLAKFHSQTGNKKKSREFAEKARHLLESAKVEAQSAN